MIAAFKIRAVPININFRYVEDELAYLFDNADGGRPARPRVRDRIAVPPRPRAAALIDR
jgi:hypothetical protein